MRDMLGQGYSDPKVKEMRYGKGRLDANPTSPADAKTLEETLGNQLQQHSNRILHYERVAFIVTRMGRAAPPEKNQSP